VSLPADRLGKDYAPPKLHEAPQFDLKVVPKARNIGGAAIATQEQPKPIVAAKPILPNAEPPEKLKGKAKKDPK